MYSSALSFASVIEELQSAFIIVYHTIKYAREIFWVSQYAVKCQVQYVK